MDDLNNNANVSAGPTSEFCVQEVHLIDEISYHLPQVDRVLPPKGYSLIFGRWDKFWGMWIEDKWAMQLKEQLSVNINRAMVQFVSERLSCGNQSTSSVVEVDVVSRNFTTITGKVLRQGAFIDAARRSLGPELEYPEIPTVTAVLKAAGCKPKDMRLYRTHRTQSNTGVTVIA